MTSNALIGTAKITIIGDTGNIHISMNQSLLKCINNEIDLIYENEEYFIQVFHPYDNVLLIENFAFSQQGLSYHIFTGDFEHLIGSIDYKAYSQFRELLNV